MSRCGNPATCRLRRSPSDRNTRPPQNHTIDRPTRDPGQSPDSASSGFSHHQARVPLWSVDGLTIFAP